MAGEAMRLASLRDRLGERLRSALGDVEENGDTERRLPHSLNLAIRYVDSNTLLQELTGVAASSGSACSSAQPHPSHVLMAMFADEDRVRSSIRLGLMRFTTEEDVARAGEEIIAVVRRLRGRSGLFSS